MANFNFFGFLHRWAWVFPVVLALLFLFSWEPVCFSPWQVLVLHGFFAYLLFKYGRTVLRLSGKEEEEIKEESKGTG